MSGANLMIPARFIQPFIIQSFLVTKVATNATSIALAKPSDVVEGDLMVAFVSKDGNSAITPPAGWTTIKDGGSAGGQMRFTSYWKEAGPSEPGTYTFTGDSQQWVGAVVRITGHEAGDPINAAHRVDFDDDLSGVPDTAPVCPDIPTWADDTLVLRAFGADDDDITVDGGYPAGLTGRYDDKSNTGSGTCSTGLASKAQATKGATGAASFTLTAAEEWSAQTVAISKKGSAAQWPGNYFGSGADGAHTVTTAEQLTAVQDGAPVIKHYSSLTIDAGKSLTTDVRCKGLVVYVTGDCTINGTLKMDARGANFDPAGVAFDLSRWETGGGGSGMVANALLADESNQPLGGGGPAVFTNYKSRQPGAAGGATQTTNPANGNPGTAGGANQTGGGGGGGSSSGTGDDGGAGKRATAHSGGAAGGGAGTTGGTGDGSDGFPSGGAGGAGGSSNASSSRGGGGGGAGNPGGAKGLGGGGGADGAAGTSGTGGVVFLVVGGNLTIGAGGVVSCDGSVGGAGGAGSGFNGGGGGGSGGGRVIVLYKGTLTNNGTVRANGGAGGAKGSGGGSAAGDGGAGGAGTTTLLKVT